MDSKTLICSYSGKAYGTLNLKQCLPLEKRVNAGPVFGWPHAQVWKVNFCLACAQAHGGSLQVVGNVP